VRQKLSNNTLKVRVLVKSFPSSGVGLGFGILDFFAKVPQNVNLMLKNGKNAPESAEEIVARVLNDGQ